MMLLYRRKSLLAGCLLLLLGTGCSRVQEPVSVTAYKLDTIVTITAYGSVDKQVLTDALALCDTYEELFSKTKETSELYRLNAAAAKTALEQYPVSPELGQLITEGLSYAALSDGGFDLTIEPVSSLWDFTAENPVVPPAKALEAALSHVGYEKVSIADDTISFQSAGMGLDLGAIAKGYIADRMRDYLLTHNIKQGIISLGGNVLCIGSKPDGSAYQVGVRRPFANSSSTAMVLQIHNQSVVTSGIYERCFEQDDRFYHHILDPDTGYPYDNGIASVTIISDRSVAGDALSTVCFALGEEKGLALIQSLPDTEAAYLMTDGRILYSDGFTQYILKEG